MNIGRFLKLAPEGGNDARNRCWITLACIVMQQRIGESLLVGNLCGSPADVEVEIAQIKTELDGILREARTRFQSPISNCANTRNRDCDSSALRTGVAGTVISAEGPGCGYARKN